MCGKDEARREVYKLKEEPEKRRSKEKERSGGRRNREKRREREREKKGGKESAGIYGRKTLVRLTLYSKLV